MFPFDHDQETIIMTCTWVPWSDPIQDQSSRCLVMCAYDTELSIQGVNGDILFLIVVWATNSGF
jgi:hypothetical protein